MSPSFRQRCAGSGSRPTMILADQQQVIGKCGVCGRWVRVTSGRDPGNGTFTFEAQRLFTHNTAPNPSDPIMRRRARKR